MRMLVVEDDAMVANWTRKLLEEDGHSVDLAATCAEGIQLAMLGDHDLVITDLGLPDRGGVALVQALRQSGRSVPIIVMTGRGDHDETVAGLDAGADDYIVKPVPNAVFKARVRAALRRGGARQVDELRCDDLRLDRTRRAAYLGNECLSLTARELSVLELLMMHAGQVVTRSELLSRIWGMTFDPGTNVVDVAVSRLRQKLITYADAPRIATLRGVGFRLERAGDRTPA